MLKAVGIICLVAGVLFLVSGYSLSHSVSGQLQQVFTGSPGDKATTRYLIGGGLCALGVLQIFAAKR